MGGSPQRADPSKTRKVGGPVYVKLARRPRNDAPPMERRLWTWLRTLRRSHGLHFRRQVPIGRFIADFGCHSARLIIELDGPFHEALKDAERDAWFAKAGYRTLRFPNDLVRQDWWRVVAEISTAVGIEDGLEVLGRRLPPTPGPSPQGGGV